MKQKPDIRTVEDLKQLNPCIMSLVWLDKNGITDLADAWDWCHRSDWMLWLCNALDLLDDRELRLIACRCVRDTPIANGGTVWDLLTDDRSRQAVVVAEKYADGAATDEDLAAAYAAARAAAVAATYATTVAAAAASAAAKAAESYAPKSAAEASADARAAAARSAYAVQADIIRAIAGNPFRDSAS